MALAEAGLVALLVVGLIAGTAFAGKGGNGGGGKPGGGGNVAGNALTIGMVRDANANGAANWGDTITFQVTSTSDKPFVRVDCYQGGTWVYSGSVGFFAAYPWAKEFILRNSLWTGGAANCTATMYTTKDGIRITNLMTHSFEVGA